MPNGVFPCQQLEQDDAQGVDVNGCREAFVASCLFRGHVGRRSRRSGPAGVHRAGQPEVSDSGAAVAVQQDVAGLQVTVDQPGSGGRGACPGQCRALIWAASFGRRGVGPAPCREATSPGCRPT